MATTIGTNVMFVFGSVKMYGEMSGSLSASAGAIETSSKADGNESAFEYGRVSEAGSASGLSTTDGSSVLFGYSQAKAAMYAKTKVRVVQTEFDENGLPVAAASMTSGYVVITSVTLDSPDNDKQTVSIDFQFDGKTVDEVNPATDFLQFSMAEQTGAATINASNHTIAIEVAEGTNVTALVATFRLSALATAAVGSTPQVSGTTANDFTLPVVYAVTAGDGTTAQNWTVTVTEAS
jgi:hypothetical protein